MKQEERLTKMEKYGDVEYVAIKNPFGVFIEPNCGDVSRNAINRLATYENTGLSPEEVEVLKAENAKLYARLENAVELACKPNDVYWHRNYGTGLLELNIEMHDLAEHNNTYREIDSCAFWE